MSSVAEAACDGGCAAKCVRRPATGEWRCPMPLWAVWRSVAGGRGLLLAALLLLLLYCRRRRRRWRQRRPEEGGQRPWQQQPAVGGTERTQLGTRHEPLSLTIHLPPPSSAHPDSEPSPPPPLPPLPVCRSTKPTAAPSPSSVRTGTAKPQPPPRTSPRAASPAATLPVQVPAGPDDCATQPSASSPTSSSSASSSSLR